MVLKTVIIPALLILFGILFLLACIGEKDHRNKIVYAVTAVALFALLLLVTVWL